MGSCLGEHKEQEKASRDSTALQNAANLMHLETASGDVIRIINLKNKFVEMGGDGGGQKEGKF